MHERHTHCRRGGPFREEARRRHFGGRPGRGGGRAQRGDVRAAILALLTERPMHGYEMITELEERSGGVWRPSAGSIYPTLQLLEDEGLITGTESEGKRAFELTGEGKARAQERSGPTPWEELTAGVNPEHLKLRRSFGQLRAAARQLADSDDAAQLKAAREIVDGARKKLYGLLAESE